MLLVVVLVCVVSMFVRACFDSMQSCAGVN